MAEKVGFISLGCSKNLVDSEQMLHLLEEAGYEFTPHNDIADAVVINTCAFIDDAVEEAVENIVEMGALKGGSLRAVVVAGCMAERYFDDIYDEIPEADGIVACSAIESIADAVREALAGAKPMYRGDKAAPLRELGRHRVTPPYTAYVKLGEGCDNLCAYCAIPSIRGPLRSRSEDAIVAECRELAREGVKELVVVAQDITRYGVDLCGERRLVPLLESICAIDGFEWIRLHYMNPDGVDDALISLIAREKKIVKYVDIPVQHVDDGILKAMNRHYTGDDVRALFGKIRAEIPDAVIRTSVMTGFPGEGEEEYLRLVDFLKEYRLERAGVFTFSAQDGTPAAVLSGQVDPEIARERAERIRLMQQDIMDTRSEALVGSTVRVLCEGFDRYADVWFGRSAADSPDVDGKIFFTAENGGPAPGDFVDVLIEDTFGGDPMGRRAINN